MMNTVLRGIFGLCLLLFGLLILEKGALATFTMSSNGANDVYYASRGGGYTAVLTNAFPITHTAKSDVNVGSTTFYCTITYGQNSTGGTNRRMKYKDSSGTDKFLSYILYTSTSTFASPVIIADNTTDTTKLVAASGTSWIANTAKNLNYSFSISPTGQTFDSNVVYRDFVTVTGYTRVGAGAFNLIGSFVVGLNCTPASVMSIAVTTPETTGQGSTLDLGVIRNSEEVPFQFKVISTGSKYNVDVQSQNSGKLKHTNDVGVYDAVTSTILYDFYHSINVKATLTGGGVVNIVNRANATSSTGTVYPNNSIRIPLAAVEALQNINGSFNSGTTLKTTSGKYKDVITFTVTDGQ